MPGIPALSLLLHLLNLGVGHLGLGGDLSLGHLALLRHRILLLLHQRLPRLENVLLKQLLCRPLFGHLYHLEVMLYISLCDIPPKTFFCRKQFISSTYFFHGIDETLGIVPVWPFEGDLVVS